MIKKTKKKSTPRIPAYSDRFNSTIHNDNLVKARTLSQALPFIQKFYNKILVIKLGGSTLEAQGERLFLFIQDLVLLKTVGIHPVLVHGGGDKISQLLKKMGKKPRFLEGLRVTDPETMDIIQMMLAGLINKNLVTLITKKGGRGVGLSGKDSRIALAKPLKKGKHDYGQVGEVIKVDPELILKLLNSGYIPVIAPIADNIDNINQFQLTDSLNINADTFATEIALALKAEKLIFISDVPGVLQISKKSNSLINSLTLKEIKPLIRKKVVQGGMIPKLLAAHKALSHEVGKVHFITEEIDHSLLVELFTEDGIGTLITKN